MDGSCYILCYIELAIFRILRSENAAQTTGTIAAQTCFIIRTLRDFHNNMKIFIQVEALCSQQLFTTKTVDIEN